MFTKLRLAPFVTVRAALDSRQKPMLRVALKKLSRDDHA
jgi:hypothetical protein